MTVRLWIDDMKDPIIADMFGLIPGDDWQWVKTAQDARPWLFHPDPEKRPTEIALDNDLGLMSTDDGRVLANEMLQLAVEDPTYKPPAMMTCISYNPIAEDAIRRTFADIRRVVRERG